jgi:4-amino-4-deoxy-L-arabinose transferase-like glycosyltransferase
LADAAPPSTPSPSASPQRPAQPALVEALGGKRGLLDSGLPAVVFVFVNSLVTALADRDTGLRAALAAAVLTGLAVVVLRIARRETLQQAVSGFLGLGLAVFFAARSGEARGFFLPGIWINVAYGVVFLGSALIGRPIVGAIYAAVEGTGSAWREDARLRRVFAAASVFWALVFGSRAAVQGTLYVLDRPGLLAAARLIMGWPLTIAAVAITIAVVKRARTRFGVAPPAA